jgi:cytochrome P450
MPGAADPALDLVGALLGAAEQGKISEEELSAAVLELLRAGSDASLAPAAGGAMILMLNRDQLVACLRDPALWPKAAMEVLRYYHGGVLGFPVVATEDIDLHGRAIAAGDVVVASLPAAMWDPRHVSNPARFNVRRREDTAALLAAGPHHCLGADLPLIYLHGALRTLFERFPRLLLAIDEFEVPWRNDAVYVGPVALPVTW